jgi:hypothetical protein
MPTGVYTRTAAHREAVVRGKREAEAARTNGKTFSEAAILLETSTSRRRAASVLADFASEQISEAVKSDDFAFARAWIDLSEAISNTV